MKEEKKNANGRFSISFTKIPLLALCIQSNISGYLIRCKLLKYNNRLKHCSALSIHWLEFVLPNHQFGTTLPVHLLGTTLSAH